MRRSTLRTLALPVLTVVLLASWSCAGPEPPEPAQRTAPSRTYTMEELLRTTSVRGGSFNPDETKVLVHTNASGVFNVAVIDIATGEQTPVTSGDDTTISVAFMPEDERILFSRDSGGNEVYHLFLRELDGTVRELTEGEQTREVFFGFAHDLKSFFTVNNSRDPRFMDVYGWDLTTLKPVLLYRNVEGLMPAGISPDKRWLALGKANSTNDTDLLIQDLGSDAPPVLISEHQGMASFAFEDFSADSRYLYYSSNAEGEYATLWRYDLGAGTHEEVLATSWDVAYASISHDGTYRVVATNEDGYTKIRVTNMTTGEDLSLPSIPGGTIDGAGISRSEHKILLTVSSDTMPRNLFLYDIDSGKLTQLTDTLDPSIDTGDLVPAEVVRLTARDGLEIPGLLYRPLGATLKHKVPALVMVHGGPGGQSRPGYSAERQLLINHGYAVFSVNNRGSSGYGKSFLAADDQRHGHEPLWDCIDAKGYLASLDWVDPDRIGIIGGSYGGYMVLAALAFEPEEFEVGIDLFGVANWVRTLESIPAWWESQREALYQELGNPETQAEMLHDISPVFFGDRIVRPLLILQGTNDPRVLKAESDDMVEAIRGNGGTVEYIVFPDEGHGFSKNENRIRGWDAVIEFLDTYLRGDAAAQEPAAEAAAG